MHPSPSTTLLKLFCAVGLIMLLVGLVWMTRAVIFYSSADHLTGTVIGFSSQPGGGRAHYAYRLSFVTLDQQTKTFSSQHYTSDLSLRQGDPIDVLYDAKTGEIEINQWTHLWLFPCVFTALGLLFSSLPMHLLYVSNTATSKKERLQRTGEILELPVAEFYTYGWSEINGTGRMSGYRVVLKQVDPDTQKERVFKSDLLWTKENVGLANKTMPVYVNPNNPKDYWIDISKAVFSDTPPPCKIMTNHIPMTLRIFFVIGVFLSVAAIYKTGKAVGFYNNSYHASGTVTGFVMHPRAGDTPTTYSYKIQFYTKENLQKNIVTKASSSGPLKDVGDKIDVFYNPDEGVGMDAIDLWGAAALIGVLAFGFMGPAISLWVFGITSPAKRKNLQQTGIRIDADYVRLKSAHQKDPADSQRRVILKGIVPGTGEEKKFKSDVFFVDLRTPVLLNKTLPVYINPQKSKDYWVDLSGAEIIAAENA